MAYEYYVATSSMLLIQVYGQNSESCTISSYLFSPPQKKKFSKTNLCKTEFSAAFEPKGPTSNIILMHALKCLRGSN